MKEWGNAVMGQRREWLGLANFFNKDIWVRALGFFIGLISGGVWAIIWFSNEIYWISADEVGLIGIRVCKNQGWG